MTKGLVWAALLACGLVTSTVQAAKEGKPEALVRWRFVGTKQISSSKDLATLRKILALPESAALRDAAIQNFSAKSSHFTKDHSTNANPAAAALMTPLLPDLFQSESRLELRTRAAKDADWVLAIKLSPERSEVWSKNLADLTKLARHGPLRKKREFQCTVGRRTQ